MQKLILSALLFVWVLPANADSHPVIGDACAMPTWVAGWLEPMAPSIKRTRRVSPVRFNRLVDKMGDGVVSDCFGNYLGGLIVTLAKLASAAQGGTFSEYASLAESHIVKKLAKREEIEMDAEWTTLPGTLRAYYPTQRVQILRRLALKIGDDAAMVRASTKKWFGMNSSELIYYEEPDFRTSWELTLAPDKLYKFVRSVLPSDWPLN